MEAGWIAFSSQEVVQSLSGSILATTVVMKRQQRSPSMLALMSSCVAEVVLRSMRGSGALPVGVMTPSLVDVPQDILVTLKVADSVMPLWGDLWHSLSECPEFDDLRAQWSSRCGISPQFAQAWSRHSWIFDPSSVLNSPGSIRAHIYFVGAVCERFDSTSAV